MKTVNVEIVPNLQALKVLHLSKADFHGALESALDGLAQTPKEQLPGPGDIALVVRGQHFRLGDLARIDVTFDGSKGGAGVN